MRIILSLEDRMKKIETTNRRLILALVGLASLLVFIGAAGQFEASVSGEIKSKSFVLIDEQGNQRALLGASKNGTQLVFFDSKMKKRIELEYDDQGAFLVLSDKMGTSRAVLAAPQHSTAEITLYDERHSDTWSAP
jgi:hypothetical protein